MASAPQNGEKSCTLYSDGVLVDTQDSSQDANTCSLQTVPESPASVVAEKLEVSSNCKPSKSTVVSAKWSKRNVHKLIELHQKFESMFAKPKIKKKYVWGLIAEHLVADGFQVTAERAEQKWKNITKTYRDTIDFNNRSGNPTKQCPFFKELQKAYDYKPYVHPRVIGSVGCSSDLNMLTGSNKLEFSEVQDMDTASSTDIHIKAKKLKTRHFKNTSVIDLLEDLKTEMIKQHEVLITVLNEQHKDRMDNENKKLELIAELVESVKK